MNFKDLETIDELNDADLMAVTGGADASVTGGAAGASVTGGTQVNDNNMIKQWLLEHAETLVKNIEMRL